MSAVTANHLLHLLAEIEHGYTTLKDTPEYATRVIGERLEFSNAYGSRPPLNIAALDLTVEAAGDSIPGELAEWVRRIVINRGGHPGGSTVAEMIGYLRLHNHWAAEQPWAPQYQKRLTSLRHRLRDPNIWGNSSPLVQDTFEAGECIEVIHDVTPPRDCHGTVHVTRRIDQDNQTSHRARCDTCGRVYDAGALTLLLADHARRNREAAT